MAVFFFLVGLELKREVLEGHLSTLRQSSLPAFAAVGGMLAPAGFYAAFNWGDPEAMAGWAIPTATDIAFALGVLSLLGGRIPAAYFVIGIPLWIAVLKSGVHATLAGVALAFFIPPRLPAGSLPEASESPARRPEHMLHPWAAFGILPLFAFANARVPLVDISLAETMHPVPLGIAVGLVLGSPVGVTSLCWIATRLKLASLPEGVGGLQLHGTALLCGIGFTMSLFIASLAFEQGSTDYLGLERLGILIGSLVSGLLGYAVLRWTLSGRTAGHLVQCAADRDLYPVFARNDLEWRKAPGRRQLVDGLHGLERL